MKANFALKLSNDGIDLIHRAADGWRLVGTVSFATDDVAQGCARLVAQAEALEPTGFVTKLILPESELRYEAVTAPGPTEEARRYQIEAEIEGLVPYAIDEMVYDWSVEDDQVVVVFGARETLAEAEGFAEGYGFRPVGFVAAPEGVAFAGEPYFGPTLVASVHLPKGQAMARDLLPVRVIGPVKAVPVVAKPAPEAAPEATPVQAEPVKAAPVVEMPKVDVAKPDSAGPRVAAVPPPSRPAGDAAAKPLPPRPASTVGKTADSAGAPPLARVSGLVRRMGNKLRGDDSAEAAPAAVKPPVSSSAPVKPVVPPVAAVPAPKPVTPTPTPALNASGEPEVAFSSRRAAPPRPVVVASGPGLSAAPGQATPGGRLAITGGAAAATGFAAGLAGRLGEGARGLVGKAGGALAALKPSAGAEAAPKVPETLKAALAAPVPGKTAGAGAAERAALVPGSVPPATLTAKQSEAEALTIFGARGRVQDTGGARRGLLIAGGALSLLIAVGVWALYFNGGSDEATSVAGVDITQATDAQVPASTETAGAIAAPETAAVVESGLPDSAAAPQGDSTALAALPDTAAAPTGALEAALPDTSGAGVETTDPDALLESLVAQALQETAPEALVPETHVADAVAEAPVPESAVVEAAPAAASPASPAGSSLVQGTDSPLLATAEVPVQRLALPSGLSAPNTTEVPFAAPAPPPPFGVEFALDERGLVEATPEGALTPTGVTVTAGRPPVAPVTRAPDLLSAEERAALAEVPAPVVSTEAVNSALSEALAEAVPETAAVEAPVAETPVAEAPAVEAQPDETPRADPALAGFRPQPRSERVRALGVEAETPEPPAAPAAEGQQDAALAVPDPAQGASEGIVETAALDADAPPPGGVSLAALRPQSRPEDLLPAALIPNPLPDEVSEQAVARSLVPSQRPRDLAARAQAVLAAAAAAPAAPSASSGAPEDVEEDEGESVSTASVTIPTTADVARNATETNALRLNQTNLIGVFGAANSRRALVRLSSGRVVRVSVGDQLDGGRVTAIGEDALRYTSGGREQVLEIGG